MANENDYFDYLESHANLHASVSLRSDATVNSLSRGVNNDFRYDATEDACECRLAADNDSPTKNVFSFTGLKSALTGGTDTSVLVVWDNMWPTIWGQTNTYCTTMKTFQLGDEAVHPGLGDARRIEPQIGFGQTLPDIATMTMRYYHWTVENPESSGEWPDMQGQVDTAFTMAADRWNRFWIWLDMEAQLIQIWISDEVTDPVLHHTQLDPPAVPFTVDSSPAYGVGTDEFWLEYNTSQNVINQCPQNDNVLADITPPNGSPVALVGTETEGTFLNAQRPDNPNHVITGTSTALDLVYEFDLSATLAGSLRLLHHDGRLGGSGNTCDVLAWNFDTDAWVSIGTLSYSASEQKVNFTFDESGAAADYVNGSRVAYIRFTATGQTDPVLITDQLVIGAQYVVAYSRNISILANITESEKDALIAIGSRPLSPLQLANPKARRSIGRLGRRRI